MVGVGTIATLFVCLKGTLVASPVCGDCGMSFDDVDDGVVCWGSGCGE